MSNIDCQSERGQSKGQGQPGGNLGVELCQYGRGQKIMILVRSVVPYMCIRSPISLTSLTSSERNRCIKSVSHD